MGLQEQIDKILADRSAMLDNYTPLYQTAKTNKETERIAEKDEIKDILFQTGTYIGIDTLIDLYWSQADGFRTGTGSLGSDLTSAIVETWQFDNDVYNGSDGTLKAGPSAYITDNGNTLGSSTSIYQQLIDLLGEEASAIGNEVSGYIYASSALALTAGQTRQDNRNGSGLLGIRTADDDPLITEQSGLWRYNLGDGVLENPDSWDSNVLTYLDTLITNISNLKTNNLDIIDNFFTTLNDNPYIPNKDLFSSFDSDWSTFYDDINTQLTTLQNHKSTLNSLVGDLVGNRASINVELILLKNNVQSYKTEGENRISDIRDNNTIFGDPTVSGTINYVRESILSSLVSFPDGIIEIIRLSSLNDGSVDNKLQKDSKKSDAYGIPLVETIPKPQMVSVAWVNSRTEVNLRWISPQFPSKYKIYRKLVSEVTDNDQWSETYLIDTITHLSDIDPETSWTAQYYTDDTANPTENYVYRVKAIDDYWSTQGAPVDNTESLQGDVYDNGEIITNTRTF